VEEPATRERLLALARVGGLTVRTLRDASAETAERERCAGQSAIAAPTRRRPEGSDLDPNISRLTVRLRADRLAGRSLDERERQYLLALRGEIEQRLAGAS
jgi:hypothetical protein